MEPNSLDWKHYFVQFGLGAFETMRCIDGKVPLIEFHLERLSHALEAWGIKNFHIEKAWEAQSKNLSTEGQFRIKWFLGLDSNLKVSDHLYQQSYQSPKSGLKCLLLPAPFTSEQLFKSSSYDQHWLAHQKATQHGCDDAIYQMPDGQLVECSRASIALTKTNRGQLAIGPSLKSVCARALKQLDPTFWNLQTIHLNELQGQLWACNALHGMQRIQSIVNPDQEVLYSANDTTHQDSWNSSLFGISQ